MQSDKFLNFYLCLFNIQDCLIFILHHLKQHAYNIHEFRNVVSNMNLEYLTPISKIFFCHITEKIFIKFNNILKVYEKCICRTIYKFSLEFTTLYFAWYNSTASSGAFFMAS